MKVYKVYRTEYGGGMGDSISKIQLGYFANLKTAFKCANTNTQSGDAKPVLYAPSKDPDGYGLLCFTEDGAESIYPYVGIVIEEIEVSED